MGETFAIGALCGAAVAGMIGWLLRPLKSGMSLHEIQSEAAREARTQVDDASRVLAWLRAHPEVTLRLLDFPPADHR